MDFKVDYILLNDKGVDLGDINKDFTRKVQELLKIVDDLERYWSGRDYDYFKENILEFCLGLNPMIEDIDYISKFMSKAARVYSSNDSGWLNRVKKIGVDDNDKQQKYHIG